MAFKKKPIEMIDDIDLQLIVTMLQLNLPITKSILLYTL